METRAAEIHEHDGMLWKASPGSTVTFAEFLSMRQRMMQLVEESSWNPWQREECRAEEDRIIPLLRQWKRAEPGLRQLTEQELRARMDEWDRSSKAEFAAATVRMQRDKSRYDSDREHARLLLLERESRIAHTRTEIRELQDGRFPAWDGTRRAEAIAKLEGDLARHEAEVLLLGEQIGDREDVVDKEGRRPQDRRESHLLDYRFERQRLVSELQEQTEELSQQLAATKDRGERSVLRSDLAQAELTLQKLLDVPPLKAEDMCSECATPVAHHGWVTPPFDGPCPAWPGWAARLQEARKILERASNRADQDPNEVPRPRPLATLPASLPIAEVIARLTALQKEHPTAIVKRGRGGKIELWPESGGRS